MTTLSGPLSYAATAELSRWVPQPLAMHAWQLAWQCYYNRATTTDGSSRQWAAERADRFWPLYLNAALYVQEQEEADNAKDT